jgi:hypothetical protein
VADQLNDPHASVLPLPAAINPPTQPKAFKVAGWPLDNAKEFLIKKGHDLSGHCIIIQFPSWDSDRLDFIPTPLVALKPHRRTMTGQGRDGGVLSISEALCEFHIASP